MLWWYRVGIDSLLKSMFNRLKFLVCYRSVEEKTVDVYGQVA